MLDDRRSTVLQALVEEYISTGEPVSSQAILERSGLSVSSATIRNDLAKLESYGFVTQPHTSAGRVPTPGGYRYFVDHCSPARLRSATRARIESFFADVHKELGKLLKETSSLLSDVSHYPSVVIGPGFGAEVIGGIHLVHLGSSVVLAVTVSESGRVSQEIVRLGFDPTDGELDESEVLLQRLYTGRSVDDGAQSIALLDREAIPDRVGAVIGGVAGALRRSEESTSDIYIGGTSQFAALWEDLANVSAILGLLEQDSSLRDVLGDEDGPSVRIGGELNLDDVDLSVVSMPYVAGGKGAGRVGVLGPMRMDYRRAIKIVEEVGEGLGDSFGS
jgi:heat-inducible transcriptional repressor